MNTGNALKQNPEWPSAYVARRKHHLYLLLPKTDVTCHPGKPAQGDEMDFVVKPLYLQRDDETVKKLYLIYDSNNPAYDRFAGRTRLRPNYALLGQGNIIQELRKHFDGKGIDKDTWRVTPPVFAHENLEQNHLGSADILKEDLCAG